MADLVVTPGSVLASANATFDFGTAVVAIIAGQTVYIDTSITTYRGYRLADSDGTAPAPQFAGIALHGALAGQPLKIVVKDPVFTPGTTLSMAIGGVWQSDTAGGITQTMSELESGDLWCLLGVPLSTTTMNLNPTFGGVQ